MRLFTTKSHTYRSKIKYFARKFAQVIQKPYLCGLLSCVVCASRKKRQKTSIMKSRICTYLFLLISSCTFAADWSFSGGFVYFDNSLTQWDKNIYLIIGKSTYSSVYPMTINTENPNQYVASLPSSGWGDAEYMAVINSADWSKGSFGYDELKNASNYTAAYTAGLGASANQRYLLTPQSKENGCAIRLEWKGNDMPINFSDTEKNNCQKLDADKGLITIIFSTSSKRQNISMDAIERIYVNGSISAWNGTHPHYVLPVRSSDGCFFGTFALSDLERLGNSGQPEFVFHVFKTDGTDYTCRAHSSWEGGIDSRLIFENNGENMMLLLPRDDIAEIGQRKEFAKYIATMADFPNLNDSATVAHLTNFRRVPATTNLFRSYHPYKPDRAKFETEHERMVQLANLGDKYGIRSDIALSGNEESHEGESYTCGGKTYTTTIPSYYKSIIAGGNVLYVGTANGHTPSYEEAVFNTHGERFGQWMQEVIRFIGDDTHPAPFQIHCSLGADRTGAFCATLAALCGASWEQIATDYENTSNLRIQEYRHRNCVRYELKLLTGEDPTTFCPTSPKTGKTLAQAVADHFISKGYLTQSEIDAAVIRLRGISVTSEIESVNATETQPTKTFLNGQLCIRRAGHTYSALGTQIQ